MKLKDVSVCLITLASLLVMAFAIGTYPSSCVGAPTSVETLETMPDAKFAGWIRRVNAWAVVLTDEALKQDPGYKDELVAFAQVLRAFGDHDPIETGALGAAASQVGLGSSLTTLLVLEVESLLDAAGGLPGGPRGKAVLEAVAGGILAGAGEGL